MHSPHLASHSQQPSMVETSHEAMGSVRQADFPCVSLGGLMPWDKNLFEKLLWFLSQKKEAIPCRQDRGSALVPWSSKQLGSGKCG